MTGTEAKLGIFLVSLGSRTITPATVEKAIALAGAAGNRLAIYLLDSAELVNQKVLHNLDDGAAADRVEEQCLKLVAQVSAPSQRYVEWTRISEVLAQDGFSASLAKVRQVYEANSHFASLCENQVYVNLQPVLKRLGAKNRRHPLIKGLIDYILVELALKLSLLQHEPYDVEYGVGKDMQLWQAVLRGEFEGFGPVEASPAFVSIETSQPDPGRLSIAGVSFRYQSAPGERGLIRRARSLARAMFGLSRSTDASAAYSGATHAPTPEQYPQQASPIPSGLATPSLQDVNLTVSGISAVLGPSGSYKTTLLKLIAGHLTASSGVIRINDDDVTSVPSEARGVTTVFQDFALFPHLTGFGNVLEGGRLLHRYSRAQRRWLAGMYLRRLNVSHCADRLPRAMSGGEQQRIAIARSLMAEPRVLLLDEPTAALDSLQRDGLAKLIKQLSVTSPSLVTLIVSHDRDFVLGVADNLAVMDGGKVLAAGTRSLLLSRPPSRRVAEILGTHSAIPGTLTRGGPFVATGEGVQFALCVADAPVELTDRRCFALVRHDGVVIHRGDSFPQVAGLMATGVIADVVDHGSTLRTTVRLGQACDLVVVSTRTANPQEFRTGQAVVLEVRPDAVCVVAT